MKQLRLKKLKGLAQGLTAVGQASTSRAPALPHQASCLHGGVGVPPPTSLESPAAWPVLREGGIWAKGQPEGEGDSAYLARLRVLSSWMIPMDILKSGFSERGCQTLPSPHSTARKTRICPRPQCKSVAELELGPKASLGHFL